MIVTENYRVRDTRQPKMYPSSFLEELPGFDNSQKRQNHHLRDLSSNLLPLELVDSDSEVV